MINIYPYCELSVLQSLFSTSRGYDCVSLTFCGRDGTLNICVVLCTFKESFRDVLCDLQASL